MCIFIVEKNQITYIFIAYEVSQRGINESWLRSLRLHPDADGPDVGDHAANAGWSMPAAWVATSGAGGIHKPTPYSLNLYLNR